MIAKMTKRKPSNQFKQGDFCKTVRKRYKRRFKATMKAKDSEIMKVINDWLEDTVELVANGKKVMFSKDSYMQVIGTPVMEHKTFKQMIGKGKYLVNGVMKKADNLNSRRNDFVYGIEYVNPKTKEKIYFKPHYTFKAKVSKALRETNNYYTVK